MLAKGDIERGGIFAQLLETLDLLKREQGRRVVGLVVNKFRGDLEFFKEGVECLEARSGLPVLGVFDAPILPGSKSVVADLSWLRRVGWERHLLDYHRSGGRLLGICGGFQMLGDHLRDPAGAEGPGGEAKGLGLLRVEISFESSKVVQRVRGVFTRWDQLVDGYEIHRGESRHAGYEPLLMLDKGDETVRPQGVGAREDGIWGTYVHGLLDESSACHAFLSWLQPDRGADGTLLGRRQRLAGHLDRWKGHLSRHLDHRRLLEVLGGAV